MPKPSNTGHPERVAELKAAGECISDTHDRGPSTVVAHPDMAKARPAPSTIQGTFDPQGRTRGGPTQAARYCDACAAALAAFGMFAANKPDVPKLLVARIKLGL